MVTIFFTYNFKLFLCCFPNHISTRWDQGQGIVGQRDTKQIGAQFFVSCIGVYSLENSAVQLLKTD